VTSPDAARRAGWLPLAVVAGVALHGAALWGFTVDDAWIPARYAHHLHEGVGYRFNPGGPVTDGVTPLAFAWLLAPFAASIDAALSAARVVGAASVLLGMWALARAVERATEHDKLARLALLLPLGSTPLAAWATAGLETGLVTGLVSVGLAAGASGAARGGALLLGVAASQRPELVPLALVASLAPRVEAKELAPYARVQVARWILALLPFVMVCVARGIAFGRVAPLSIHAKAPVASLGFGYALAGVLFAGPVALVGVRGLARAASPTRWLVAAVCAHVVSVGTAGGDWMPLSRLFVPALPVVTLAAAGLVAARRARLVWLVLALVGQGWVTASVAPSARQVMRDRERVRAELGPIVARHRVVVTVDAGWVGSVTQGTVLDAAGVTDPVVAALPGGHTTRKLSPTLMATRGVDAAVLLLAAGPHPAGVPWWELPMARGAEAWLARSLGGEEGFVEVGRSSLPSLPYVVVAPRVAP
jgi:hypothetical protein